MSQQRQDNEVIETGGPPCSRERYQRYRKSLGKGAFKSVFEGFDTEHGNLVAWNQVERGNLDGKKYDEFLKEVLTLQMLNHPSIIKMSEWWESEDKCHVVFITELMTSGDLKKYIRQRKVNLRMTRKWARQILQALDYLHTNFDHPIVHRDIKCDNIFINGNLGEVKLGDLGLSTSMTQTHAASVLGTPEFMAPEMYGESYNEKVDIYAFGMCILEIFSGQYPYEECSNPGQIFMKVNKGIPPKVLIVMENVAVKHFIESCLAPIDERPTAKELLQHELLIDFMDADAAVKLSSPAPQEPLKIIIMDTSMQSKESGTDSDLSVIINAQIDGKQKKIGFDFNVTEDSAAEVAADLVEELIKNQATKALFPHALGIVFVEDVKELFTTSIEQAVLKLPVAVPIASPAPAAAAPALTGTSVKVEVAAGVNLTEAKTQVPVAARLLQHGSQTAHEAPCQANPQPAAAEQREPDTPTNTEEPGWYTSQKMQLVKEHTQKRRELDKQYQRKYRELDKLLAQSRTPDSVSVSSVQPGSQQEEPAWYTSQKMQLVKEHTERLRELDQQYQRKYLELDKRLAQSRTPDSVPAQPGPQQTLAQPPPPARPTFPSAAAASVPSSGGL